MKQFKPSEYRYRFLARIVIEADSPLAIGSGRKDIEVDNLVARDVNGLPYIPGTGIMGVVRSLIDPDKTNRFFGVGGDKGNGSEIIVSDAIILNSESVVMDGIHNDPFADKLLCKFEYLPVRQHVAINERGTAVNRAKFDDEVVYKGTRFCFEFEVVAKSNDSVDYSNVLASVCGNNLRLGGGTRKGYGLVKVVDVKTSYIDLTSADDLQTYISKSSNLEDSASWKGWKNLDKALNISDSQYDEYKIVLYPSDFFLFSSGFGDEKGYADMTPVRDSVIEWDGECGYMKDNFVLVPATSIKGTLLHRTLYYLNAQCGNYSDCISQEKNAEVKAAITSMFGKVENDEAIRGNIFVSDVYLDSQLKQKHLNHVSIDSFTGGAIEGALFTELVDFAPEQTFELNIQLVKDAVKDNAILALEKTIKDICNGILPLGGGVNRGNGIFNGKAYKNGEVL